MSGFRLAIFLVAVAAVLGGLSIAKGGLYITMHEIDTVHLVDAVMRVAEGQVPHLDFMMPIGVLAFIPIVVSLALVGDLGQAMMISQVLVAAVLLPVIWWTVLTRFSGALGYAFGATVLVFVLALVFGTADTEISFSLHYNRWCWAVAFLVVALAAVEPSRPGRPVLDGVLIGLLMAVLALTKVTYFAALALPVALSLALRREWRAMVAASVLGLSVAVLVTVAFGIDYWTAYLGDLLAVAASEVRPGHIELSDMLSAPLYLGGSLTALAAVILLRQAGRQQEGLILFAFLPAFVYITYQNFGNDPVWLVLLGLLLLKWQPAVGTLSGRGWDLRAASHYISVVAFVLIAPLILGMTQSPVRNFNSKTAEFVALIPGGMPHETLRIAAHRVDQVTGLVPLPGAQMGRGTLADTDEPPADTTLLAGEALPECTLAGASMAWMEQIARDVSMSLTPEARVLGADVVSSAWLFSDLRPLRGAAPWYYGGAPGLDEANYLLVPLCPLDQRSRRLIINAVAERGLELVELARTELYILLRIDREATDD